MSHRSQFVLPDAVDARLECLLEAVRKEGNIFSRSDIVAALVWQAPSDGDALGVLIRQYRREIQVAAEPEKVEHPRGPRPLIPRAKI